MEADGAKTQSPQLSNNINGTKVQLTFSFLRVVELFIEQGKNEKISGHLEAAEDAVTTTQFPISKTVKKK